MTALSSPAPTRPGVSCQTCGHSWPRDPVLEVACPTCEAQAGQRCRVRRPSEARRRLERVARGEPVMAPEQATLELGQ